MQQSLPILFERVKYKYASNISFQLTDLLSVTSLPGPDLLAHLCYKLQKVLLETIFNGHNVAKHYILNNFYIFFF